MRCPYFAALVSVFQNVCLCTFLSQFFTLSKKEDDMQQKLLRKAGLLGIILSAVGVFFAGCVDEPTQPTPPHMFSTVRWVHANADLPAVDLYVDGDKMAEFTGKSFKDVSTYNPNVKAGIRYLRLVPAGSNDTAQAIYRRQVNFRSFMKTTVVFYSNQGTPDVLVTQERFTYADETKALGDTAASIKLINVNTAEVAISLVKDDVSSGPTLIGPVDSYSLSSYTMLRVGAMKMFILNADGAEMTSFDFTAKAKTRYSFILVGDLAAPVLLPLTDDAP
jgi:hypothetical protein